MISVDQHSLPATDQTGINCQNDKLNLQYSTPYSNNLDKRQKGFKPCAGKDCEDIGIHKLLIIYIDKIAYFCSSCKEDLERLGLVSKSE